MENCKTISHENGRSTSAQQYGRRQSPQPKSGGSDSSSIIATLPKALLLIAVSLIFVIGLIMIYSTTSADLIDHDLLKDTHQALSRQMTFALIGFLGGFAVHQIGYRRLLAFSPLLLAIFSFLLVLTLIPGIGKEVNGSKRWLHLLGFSVQPSEFVKYIVPTYFIHRFLQFDLDLFTFKDFLKLVGTVAIPIFLIMIEPNNGTAAVVGMSVIVLCLLMQIPLKYWALPLLILICIGSIFAFQLPYISARLKVYLNPELDLKGKGHQPYQAKIAAGSGRLFGKGPGNSLQKLSYLPEAQNDYIAAIYAEEFGFIGMLVLVGIYMTVSYLGFVIASHAPDQAAFYLASSITFLIGFQAFLNLGVVSGLLPSTGLNLPFFSQGGTSLMANIIGISILLSLPQRSLEHLRNRLL